MGIIMTHHYAIQLDTPEHVLVETFVDCHFIALKDGTRKMAATQHEIRPPPLLRECSHFCHHITLPHPWKDCTVHGIPRALRCLFRCLTIVPLLYCHRYRSCWCWCC